MARPENISIPANEYALTFQVSSGPGGQHVNKVATAVRLVFDIESSETLTPYQKKRLGKHADKRIGKDGMIRIRVNNFRSQVRNREEAVKRLHELISAATRKVKKRIPTKMSRAAKLKIKEGKQHRSKVKALRKKVDW